MNQPYTLSETEMQALEAHIPELAETAVRRAYYQALSTDGKVIEAVNGRLVETSANGQQRLIRTLHPPLTVQTGLRLSRRSSR